MTSHEPLGSFSALRLCIDGAASEIDADHRLIAHHPGIVPRRNNSYVARSDSAVAPSSIRTAMRPETTYMRWGT